LPLPVAQELYNWADLGTTVVVEDWLLSHYIDSFV
jgi:hypothetical protein